MKGIFDAKVKDYGTSETKAGNPQVYINFEFEDEGAVKTLTWYGSFVGGAKDITLKTLIYCGLVPQNYSRLVDFKNGVASNLLDLNKVLRIDVQEEPKQDGSGMRTVIAWVNDPAQAPAIKKIDDAKNAQFFGSMGFDRDLIRLAGDLGVPLNMGQTNAAMTGQQMPAQNYQTMGNQQAQNNVQGAGNHQPQAQSFQANQGNGFANNASHSNNQPQMNFQQPQSQGNGQANGTQGFNAPF